MLKQQFAVVVFGLSECLYNWRVLPLTYQYYGTAPTSYLHTSIQTTNLTIYSDNNVYYTITALRSTFPLGDPLKSTGLLVLSLACKTAVRPVMWNVKCHSKRTSTPRGSLVHVSLVLPQFSMQINDMDFSFSGRNMLIQSPLPKSNGPLDRTLSRSWVAMYYLLCLKMSLLQTLWL